MSNKRCNVCANPMEVWGYSRMDEHTIFKCPKCGNEKVVKDADIPLPKHKQSVFDRITESPEVLAETYMFNHDGKVFKSLLLPNMVFNSREEAHAATVARLKEVAE